MTISFKDVIQSKYLLLTTFTKDGRPKPTAIWGVPEGDKLLIKERRCVYDTVLVPNCIVFPP